MMLHEVLPTLDQPHLHLATYVDEVLGRFANARLPYATRQVGGDGSQKLPGRILGSASDQLAAGRDADRLATVVAAFAACTLGPRASELALIDPVLDRLLGGARPTGLDASTAVERLLALVPVFGADLPRDPAFRAVVLEQAELLWRGDLTSVLARPVA
jgi:fructuronate reductase